MSHSATASFSARERLLDNSSVDQSIPKRALARGLAHGLPISLALWGLIAWAFIALR